MCHISYIMCQLSSVTRQVSGVRCHMSFLFLIFLGKVMELGVGGSVINGVYPVYHILLVKHLVVQQHFFLDLKLIKILGTSLWTNKSYFQEI